MKEIIQSMWIGEELSKLEQLCLNSYLQNGFVFHLYTYQSVKNVPKGVVVFDANEIIPIQNMFLDSRGTYATFSDWFRYTLLFNKGNCWTDMDMVCLRPFLLENEYCFISERSRDNKGVGINIGFIKSPSESDFLAEALSLIKYFLKHNKNKNDWGEFGSPLLTKILQSYESESYIMPPESFCPINWWEIYIFISKQDYAFLGKAFAIHFWNEIWRLNNLDKNAVYHPESIYELLKFKYHV